MSRLRDVRDISCRNCGEPLSRRENGQLKVYVKSRVFAITKGGDVEVRCHNCRLITRLPLSVNRDKSEAT